jgi:hypothetical protein
LIYGFLLVPFCLAYGKLQWNFVIYKVFGNLTCRVLEFFVN